jgi:hypothetical protein
LARAHVFAALHEDSTPAVRRRIEENAKVLALRYGVLMTDSQSEVRIEGKDFGLFQPCPVIFKGEDFTSAALLSMEASHKKGVVEAL